MNVGTVKMSLHTGTHADAPFHFLSDGAGIDKIDLQAYIGPARVIDVSGSAQILSAHIEELKQSEVERILFKTGSARIDKFSESFTYFTPEAAQALADLKLKLVGIDTPSVDHPDSQALDSHKIFASAGIAILENLNLSEVAAGDYELMALPLKFSGMDASPVRAVLLDSN